MKYTAQMVVRSYECDSYSHVNNAVYLNYLEFGRMEFLRQIHFDYKGLVEAGYYLYVTHIDIRYKASAYLDDKLTITIYPTKLGAVSGAFHQTISKEDGTICADADVTWASVKKGGALARIPDNFMVPELYPASSDEAL